MNVVTHALLPALLAAPFLPRSRAGAFYRAAGTVTLAGALPDLLNPHLSLAARYSSWSHSIFALGGFALLLTVTAVIAPRFLSWKMAILAAIAFGLHLFGDAVSGGIAFYHPVSDEIIRSRPRWIPYRLWWWCDAACAAGAITVIAVMSRRFAVRGRAGAGRPA